jgi:hypothetical protein
VKPDRSDHLTSQRADLCLPRGGRKHVGNAAPVFFIRPVSPAMPSPAWRKLRRLPLERSPSPVPAKSPTTATPADIPSAWQQTINSYPRFERPVTRCETIRYLLPRLRLVIAERRFVGLRLSIRCSRPELIDRISSSRTSQSSICEASTACVEPRDVNKWKRAFAARIFFNDFNKA